MAEPAVIAIKCGRLIDGTGAAPVEDVTLVISGTRIQSIARNGRIPRGAEVIDAGQSTVMPGLIDSHVHLWGIRSDHGLIEQFFRPLEVNVIKAIKDAKALLEAGFTTVRCMGGLPAVMLKLAKAEGSLEGIPRIVAAGHALSQTSTHGDTGFPCAACSDAKSVVHPPVIPGGNLVFDGVDGARKAVREAIKTGSDFIKIMGLVEPRNPGPEPLLEEFDLQEIKAVVGAAAQAGVPVAAHAIGAWTAKRAILAGVKTIEHAVSVDDEVLHLAKQRDVTVVTTLSTFYVLRDHPGEVLLIPFDWTLDRQSAAETWHYVFEAASQSYRLARDGEVRVAAGTDFGGNPLMAMGNNAMELQLLVEHCSFSPLEAIVAATGNGAKACFVNHLTGTLEVGKSADLLVVDGDPLEDISLLRDKNRIRLVMLEGHVEVDRRPPQ